MTEPFVTVILPIRNEEHHIRRTLNLVLNQDYPTDRYEVIVVDGMSIDSTRRIVSEVIYDNPQRHFQILDNPSGIVPTALNIGLNKSRGDVIIRVDGHCEISPNFIRMCVFHLSDSNADCVGGIIDTIGTTPLAKTIAVAMSSSFGVGGSAFRVAKNKYLYVDTVPFPAYALKAIKLVGIYDEEMLCNEDDEFNYRLRKFGGKILLTSDIKSIYYCRESLGALWKQYFRYGFWKVRLLQKHSKQMSFRQFVPPAFVLTLILSVVIALFVPWSRLLPVSILLSYLLVNFLASLLTASRQGWRHFLLLPVCYSVLHISYGLAFLWGLIRFINHWGN
jgi:glycosyltransferase involved in cell wall biosynthesis